MKTKITSIALLVLAGLFTSTASASAYIIYGDTVVNGTTYDLSPYADLRTAYLSDAVLPDADLHNADLTNAYLWSADLTNANLTNANLSRAVLTHADLTGATVSYSDWADFTQNSGALGLGYYTYNISLINYAGSTPVPEPSTYGLIGIGALGVAFAARRRKLKKTA